MGLVSSVAGWERGVLGHRLNVNIEHLIFPKGLDPGSHSGPPKGRAGRRGLTWWRGIASFQWRWLGAEMSGGHFLSTRLSHPHKANPVCTPLGPEEASGPDAFSACLVQRWGAQPQGPGCLALTSCVALGQSLPLSVAQVPFLENEAIIASA